ncbi:MAG: restriction endonuclease [Eubacterium sp.]|nr:restriction endonuclease [Eubacterium sp.]
MKNKNSGCGTLILAFFGLGLIYYLVDLITHNKTALIITIVIIVLLFAIVVWYSFNKQKVTESLSVIDSMDGIDFENYSAKLLRSLGFRNVSVTKASNDYGVDVTAEKNGIRYAVQCKRYSHKVDNSAIQEVVAGKRYYNCDRAIVITNSYFTDNATELARINGVELWDRDYLSTISIQNNKNARKKFGKSNKTKKDNDEIKISSITNMPYLFNYNDKDYNIEIVSDIENMPTDLGYFNWDNYRYRVDEYIDLCADIYRQKGYQEISEALKCYVKRFRRENYINDDGVFEITEEKIAANIEYHKSIDDTKDLEANYTKIIQFDYDNLIDKSIAYGALLDYIPDDVKQNLFSVGALIPSREQLYPQFSFSEKEWEDCDKNFDKLCEYLKKKNVWYNKSLEDIDRYTESDFIKYVKDLLVGLHYENIVDTDSEMGVDITCSKDDIKYAIKCQHSISNKISVKPIRNIAAGKNYYHCQVGIVITNNYYSTTAIDMANANSIILWDRDKLQNIINGNV